MATVFGSAQWRLVDIEGVETSKVIYYETDDATTLSQLIAGLTAFAPTLDAVTDAATTGIASLSINFSATGLKTTPNPITPLGNGLLTTFSQSGVPRAYSDLVPAVAAAIVTNGKVDLTPGGAYDNYRAVFLAPQTHFTMVGQQLRTLAAFRHLRLTTRKHRREQQLETTES
jgi:hypothetical protein